MSDGLDFTLEELDCDGALQESLEGIGFSRSALLGTAVVGGGALLAAFGAAPAEAAIPVNDTDILNYALTLEYLQAAFYTETERSGATRQTKMRRVPGQIGAVERAHVAAFRGVLGRKAVKRPFFNFRGVTEDADAFLRTAVAFEDLAVAAYKGQAPRLRSPQVLAAAISIHSVEARHAAWMRFLSGVLPAANAFDEGKSLGETVGIVNSTRFIVSNPNQTGRGSPRFTG